jgi:hypothetical protein
MALSSFKGRLTFTHEGCEHTTEVEIHGLLQTQLTELATLKRQHEQLRAAAERASRLGRAEWSEEERQTLRAAAIEASR